jgi:sugar phosphate isomerase/epimerase
MAKSLIYGISTTVLREHPVSYSLEQIAQAGYKSAEIWPWHLEEWDESPILLARTARQLGLNLTMHAPAGKLNPTDQDKDTAQYARDRIADSLVLATELGVQVVAVHPGRRSNELEPVEEVWLRLLSWLYELDKQAEDLSLYIGLELMERLPLEIFMLPNDATRLMSENFSRIGLTIDIAHMNTHMHPIKFMSALNPLWIIHTHLSDNSPWRVHLPLGDGDIDLIAVLKYLEKIYKGVVSIEGSVPGQGVDLLKRNLTYLDKFGLI